MNKSDHARQLSRLVQASEFLTAVYQAGSFAAAAERLDLDQSAVSHRMRSLEALLGLKLFRRTTRQVSPTRAGHLICQAAGRAVADLDRALTAVRESDNDAAVRLSVSSSLAMKWLLPLLADAQRSGLNLTLDVQEQTVDPDSGVIDAAIRFGPGPYPGYRTIKLTDCQLLPVTSPGYRMAADSDKVYLADRHGEQDDTGFSWQQYRQGQGLIDQPSGSVYYFDRAELMLQAAIGGMGIALGRTLLIEDDIRQGLLKAVGPPVTMTSAYWLITSHEQAGSERIVRLEQRLRDWIDRTRSHIS